GRRSKFLLLAHANILGMSAKRASSCNLDTTPEGNRKYFGSLIVGYQSPKGLLFAAEWKPVFPKRFWRTSTPACRNSNARLVPLRTCQRRKPADGARA